MRRPTPPIPYSPPRIMNIFGRRTNPAPWHTGYSRDEQLLRTALSPTTMHDFFFTTLHSAAHPTPPQLLLTCSLYDIVFLFIFFSLFHSLLLTEVCSASGLLFSLNDLLFPSLVCSYFLEPSFHLMHHAPTTKPTSHTPCQLLIKKPFGPLNLLPEL